MLSYAAITIAFHRTKLSQLLAFLPFIHEVFEPDATEAHGPPATQTEDLGQKRGVSVFKATSAGDPTSCAFSSIFDGLLISLLHFTLSFALIHSSAATVWHSRMATSLKFDDFTVLTPHVMRIMDEDSDLVSQDIERAGSLRAEEKYEEAAKMCKEILERDSMQSKMSKDTVVQACLYELLGDCLGESGQVEEARSYLTKAIHIRDAVEYGGLGLGSRQDAACSKERLAYLWEAIGNVHEAKELRLRGDAKGEMLCSNWICVRLCPEYRH